MIKLFIFGDIGNYGKASISKGVTNNVCKCYVKWLHKGLVPLIQL